MENTGGSQFIATATGTETTGGSRSCATAIHNPVPLAPTAAQERGPPAWGTPVSESQRKMTVKPALIHVAV
jgi:hypothetical protein